MTDRCACIVCDGEPLSTELLAEIVGSCGLVIAADGGITQLSRIGITPHLFIGDLDSATESDIQRNPPAETIRYPSDKNESDAELAINASIQRGADRVILLSAGGRRPDHFFSNLAILTKNPGQLFMMDGEYTIFSLSGKSSRSRIRIGPGRILSVFCFGEAVSGLRVSGTKWDVNNYTLHPGSLGLSNESTDDEVEVSIDAGHLLVFAECMPADVELM